MKIQVVKLGGSSFPELESYSQVANYLCSRLVSDSDRLVVVVSAMSGTTGRLLETGLKVNPNLSAEITDSLLGSGEIVAACLMRAAMEANGIPTTHLSGYQLGIITDSNFTHAGIQSIDARVIRQELEKYKVVVVSGGQAVNSHQKLTMLGRNSSDLSAVILAAALRVGECEIFSDVEGVYTADPYLVEDAQLIREIPYDALIQMSLSGAKVLHHRSVEQAKLNDVKIVCRSIERKKEIGTVVGRGATPNTVTMNSKILTLRFQSRAERNFANLFLASKDIVGISVDVDWQPFLTVSTENRGWIEVLKDLDLEVARTFKQTFDSGFGRTVERIDGLALVTELYSNHRIVRSLLSAPEAIEFSKKAHAKMITSSEGSRQVGAVMEKRRARMSGLLVSGG